MHLYHILINWSQKFWVVYVQYRFIYEQCGGNNKDRKMPERIYNTLIPLLRIPSLGRIGSRKLVLPKWQNIDILNRGIRV